MTSFLSYSNRNASCSYLSHNGSDAESHFDPFASCRPSGTINLENVQAAADSPANGILLRADIHIFFDAYQFAFLVPLVN
jgi:HNH endonuclease